MLIQRRIFAFFRIQDDHMITCTMLLQETVSLFSRVVSDTDMSAPSAPPVDPIAWEEESTEVRTHRRARHLQIANDSDPKHKSISQQALALAGPLADVEDAIIHMDGFSLGDADSDLFEGHIKVLRKMRSARGNFGSHTRMA